MTVNRHNRDKPRIVHIVPCDGYGGVETAARSAAEQSELPCNLTLYFLAGRTLADRKHRIIDRPSCRLNSPLTYFSAIREVISLKPQVIVCSLWRSMLVGLALKWMNPQCKLVIFLHSPRTTHRLDRMTHGLALRGADEVWVDSRATLNAFDKTTRAPLRQISLVTRRREPLAGAAPAAKFISWSRFHPHKGHDRSLELLDHLVKLGVDAHLQIWGSDGGARAALWKQCETLKLADRVQFPGEAQNVRLSEIAFGHSFYLSLSRLEGFGMGVVEAMQLGLIPIVTAVGEPERYIRDGENGLLVDPKDLAIAAERIRRLLDCPEEIQSLSLAAARTWRDVPIFSDSFCIAANAVALGQTPPEV